jgi:phosphatidylinositol-3-phosphatase
MHRVGMLLARAVVVGAMGAAAIVAMGGATAVASSPCGHTSRAPVWRHIVVIAFENHSYQQILGRSAPASYFKTLAGKCGSAVDYQAAHFPRSLPNYLAATGGRIVTTSDCLPGPECESGGPNIFSQVGGKHWRTFAESMPTPCDRQDTSLYMPRHAPAAYYVRIPGAVCRRDLVTLPAHRLKLRRTFTWIAPNLQHDLHDGSLAQASQWLQGFLGGSNGLLHRHPYVDGHTAVFIWFDSAGGNGLVTTPIPFIVISPSTPHKLARKPLNQYGALRGWEGMLGLPCIANACDANGTRLPFHL